MADPIAAFEARADHARAAEMAAYHKVPRRYLGIAAPEIYALADEWRAGRSIAERVRLAAMLWDTDIHEARMAAARLLTQARIREDEPLVWDEFLRWVPAFDGWALADHACKAGERRLAHEPARLDVVEHWTAAESLWTRRAALVVTLPWAKLTHPTARQLAERERILDWAAAASAEPEWFMQKAVAGWIRSLGKHDRDRARAFLDANGARMKPFARRDAARTLPPPP
jgi:3-methyladenine DNA glycosylase AlkD